VDGGASVLHTLAASAVHGAAAFGERLLNAPVVSQLRDVLGGVGAELVKYSESSAYVAARPIHTIVMLCLLSVVLVALAQVVVERFFMGGIGSYAGFPMNRPKKENRCFPCGGFGMVRCELCTSLGFLSYERKLQHMAICPKCSGRRWQFCEKCMGTGLRHNSERSPRRLRVWLAKSFPDAGV